jgi:tetratricopeptide (TPR) repeat protein
MLLVTAWWVWPYVLSIYHLEVAGALLESSLVPVYPDRLAPERITDPAGVQEAIKHLQKAVSLDPRNVQALRLLARAYLSCGQPQMALQVLQKALVVRPQNPLLHLELADVYDSLGYTEYVIHEYEMVGVGTRSAPLVANYLKLADAQIEAGGGEIAIWLWYKVLTMDPYNLYALYRLYKIHREMGDTEHAAIYRKRLASINPHMVAVPLDFRLAEYQAKAMIALVKDGIWEQDKVIAIVSNQLQQSGQGLPRLIIKHLAEVLLEQWPNDPILLSYLAELHSR